jgi:MFS transporter, MHS family, proline/betaine transporter
MFRDIVDIIVFKRGFMSDISNFKISEALPKQQRRNIYLALFGNALEYYDLYLYIHMGVILNQKFFPHLPQDHFILKNLGLLNMYLFVPIACIFWALAGDLRGRKGVLIASSSIAACTTFLVCLLPEYNAMPEGLGTLTIAFFILLRLIQGFAMAGEPYAAFLYCVEGHRLPVLQTKKGLETIYEKEIPKFAFLRDFSCQIESSF